MIFSEADKLLKVFIRDYCNNEYDGIVVKKLSSSNTLDEGRTTNQTHIAITGDQMNMFPYVYSDGYFVTEYDRRDENLKKYFMIQIPLNIYKKNYNHLGGSQQDFGDKDRIKSKTTIIKSRRNDQTDQIQMSFINYDDSLFIGLRRLIHTDDYLIFAKLKGKFEYDCFGIKNSEAEKNGYKLELLNNSFYKISTQTVVPIEDVLLSTEGNSSFEEGNGIFEKAKGGLNKIYYGAPGCGKSFYVKRTLDEIGVVPKNRIRVTFHPEYSNSDFVGQILPSIEEKYDDTGEKQEIVKYSFQPGPFTLALQQSYRTKEMVYLIIEEINRGNAAAIFGDLFQLLDREKDETKNNFSESEYPIDNPNIQKYLSDSLSEEGIEYDGRLVIPSNLTIFATMNSSDQNVFTMDTAFKRRWTFEQISNEINADNNHSYKNWYIPGTAITWATFLTKVNDRILENKIYNQTNEDKRMGKYFVTKDCLTELANSDDVDAANNFAYKVLEYLWNDVCKIGREDWFDTGKYRTLEELISGFLNPAPNSTPLSIFQNIPFNA